MKRKSWLIALFVIFAMLFVVACGDGNDDNNNNNNNNNTSDPAKSTYEWKVDSVDWKLVITEVKTSASYRSTAPVRSGTYELTISSQAGKKSTGTAAEKTGGNIEFTPTGTGAEKFTINLVVEGSTTHVKIAKDTKITFSDGSSYTVPELYSLPTTDWEVVLGLNTGEGGKVWGWQEIINDENLFGRKIEKGDEFKLTIKFTSDKAISELKFMAVDNSEAAGYWKELITGIESIKDIKAGEEVSKVINFPAAKESATANTKEANAFAFTVDNESATGTIKLTITEFKLEFVKNTPPKGPVDVELPAAFWSGPGITGIKCTIATTDYVVWDAAKSTITLTKDPGDSGLRVKFIFDKPVDVSGYKGVLFSGKILENQAEKDLAGNWNIMYGNDKTVWGSQAGSWGLFGDLAGSGPFGSEPNATITQIELWSENEVPPVICKSFAFENLE